MSKEQQDWATKIALMILKGLWKALVFCFWVVSSAVVILLKTLNDAIKEWLWGKN